MDHRVMSTDHLIPDWLEQIHDVNEERERMITEGSKFYIPFMSLPTPLVKTVFIICDFHELAPRTKYLALDIHERFMCNKFWEIFKSTEKDQSSIYFEEERCKYGKLTKLHLVCSIILASKMESLQSSMGTLQVQSVLDWLNSAWNFTSEEINEAEFDIYKTIDFKIPLVTIFDCVEILLAALDIKSIPNINDIANHILDLSYMQHERLYRQLQLMTHGSLATSKSDKIKYMTIQSNMLLLSAAIIESVLTILNIKLDIKDKISNKLEELVDIRLQDIQWMSKMLIAMIIPEKIVETKITD